MASRDEEIIKAVETWRQVYEAADPQGLKNLWCRDDRKVSYLPTENATILRSMAEIDAYYDRVCEALTDLGVRWSVWDLSVDLEENADMAVATCYVDMDSADLYWQGRACFIFKRQADAWLIVHYEDSTLYNWILPQASRYVEGELKAIRSALSRGELSEAERLVDEASRPIRTRDLPRIDKSERKIPGLTVHP
jgi:ketosteroid isomerase-like protein